MFTIGSDIPNVWYPMSESADLYMKDETRYTDSLQHQHVQPDILSECCKTLELLANWSLPITTWQFQEETLHNLRDLTATCKPCFYLVFIVKHGTFYHHLLELLLCTTSSTRDHYNAARYYSELSWCHTERRKRRVTVHCTVTLLLQAWPYTLSVPLVNRVVNEWNALSEEIITVSIIRQQVLRKMLIIICVIRGFISLSPVQFHVNEKQR